MRSKNILLSIIVNAHHEGIMAHRSVKSLARAIAYVDSKFAIEVIAVLDKPDAATTCYFNKNIAILGAQQTRIVRTNYGDPGSARRHGSTLATGKYVGFLDADNLVSENWLAEAISFLEKYKSKNIIVHPETFVSFDAQNLLWKQYDSLSAKFNPYSMIDHNYWDAICITKREIFSKIPYPTTKVSEGFGIEDWVWNCQTLEVGFEHYVVPRTIHFYRVKPRNSMLSLYGQQGVLLPPIDFLRPKAIDKYQRLRLAKSPNLPKNTASYRLKEFVRKPQVHRPIKQAILKTLYVTTKYTHKLTIPAFRIHLRLRDFEYSLRNAAIELLQPPRPTPITSEEIERRRKIRVSKLSWLEKEWRSMHQIEPKLFPNEAILSSSDGYQINVLPFTYAYWTLANKLMTAQYDYVFLVPWIKKGGSDLELFNYVEAILDTKPRAKILVMATEATNSPWAHRLPKSVKFVNISQELHKLSHDQQIKLLATLLMQMHPGVIHLINSHIGFQSFTIYAKPLSKYSKLFISIFCLDYISSDQKWHYIIEYFEPMADYIQTVFADNQHVIDELIDIYALPKDKFQVHYQPFSIKSNVDLTPPKALAAKFSPTSPLKVLWAGRLDTQKRPDILLKIANKANKQKLPIEFHVYGSTYLDKNEIADDLKQLPNIKFHGAFNKGVGKLPLNKYDVFLLTSQWEGFPNTQLEATAGGLAIVAPAVGGIPELIQNDSTGFLISHYEEIDEYIKAFKAIIRSPESVSRLVKNTQKILKTRHNWQSFVAQLKSHSSYLK